MVTLDSLQWTVKKYVLHNIWHLILIGIGTTFVDLVYICPEKSFWEVVVLANTQVVLKGAIPIALITLFLKNRMLKETLQKAMESNREIERITAMKSEPSRTANTITLQSDTSETATFKLPDLLFIEADDNYSTIIWKNGHGMEKKLLRANLKNIENQLNNPYTIRCHRSYIVNVNAIASISGNANGYKLLIRDTDITIPVSRPKGREVMDKISQLRNMMELST
jgi:DNA-binding LytR/AlgR family response regulator